MIQIEAAGPNRLAEFQISPDAIRGMAEQIIHTCVEGPSQEGGFLTSSVDGLIDWITNVDTDLNGIYRKFCEIRATQKAHRWIAKLF